MPTGEIVARKHWIAYLKILLGYGIWFLILLAIMGFLHMTPGPGVRFHGEKNALRIGFMIVLIVFAISALFFLLAWMEIKRFTWTAGEENLTIRSGWLPWQRTKFGIAYDTIFESYVTFGFFAKLFGYRTCVIRRTEGVTSGSSATYMTNGEKLSQAINRKIKEARVLRYARPQMISEVPHVEPSRTPTEQLKDLAALKADGTITTEEFDLMKRKIIQS